MLSNISFLLNSFFKRDHHPLLSCYDSIMNLHIRQDIIYSLPILQMMVYFLDAVQNGQLSFTPMKSKADRK